MNPFIRRQRIIHAAYRGLWTESALPGSVDAIRRAYLSGLPALVAESAACSFSQLLHMAADAAVNRFHQPVYVLVPALPSAPVMRGATGSLDVFAIVRGQSTAVWSVWRWLGLVWEPAGAYVPATVAVENLFAVDFDSMTNPIVIYESPDVISMFGERARIGELDDVQLRQAVRAYAGPEATIVRISDMFEVDNQQASVEAA